MAQILPDLAPSAAGTPGRYIERQLLETLSRGLSSAYAVFHDIDRAATPGDGGDDADILVVNRAGDVLRIDVAAGAVEVRADGLYRRGAIPRQRLDTRFQERFSTLRLQLRGARLPVQVGHLVVLTHVRVQDEAAPWPREMIVDSGELPDVVAHLAALLPPGEAQDAGERVRRFFEQRFDVALDADANADAAQPSRPGRTTRLRPGLATWAPRIKAPSGVLRVDGTAGSGKSQLASGWLKQADAAGQSAAYIAFNRAQVDRMARLAPPHTHVRTFHDLARELCLAAGITPVLGTDGVFDAMSRQAIELLQARTPDVDVLVVDEMHDMQPGWVEALLWRLRPGGRALLLEDRDQRLYDDRLQFDVPGAVEVDVVENFRSPRAIVRAINALGLASRDIAARSTLEGRMPERLVCATPAAVESQTIRAIERCLSQGFELAEIAVVTLCGRDGSQLLGRERLGPWTLRVDTGRLDDEGDAIWTAGELTVETLRRFKGDAAPAVVVTECHLPRWRTLDRRMLLVALTRARQHVEWVLSAETDTAIRDSLAN